MTDFQSDIDKAQDTLELIKIAGGWAEKLTGCQEWGMFAFQFGETPSILISGQLYERMLMMPGLHSPHRRVPELEMLRNYALRANKIEARLQIGIEYRGYFYAFPDNGEPTEQQTDSVNKIAKTICQKLTELEDPDTYRERVLLLQVSSDITASSLGAARLAIEGVKRAHDRQQPEKLSKRCEMALDAIDKLGERLRTIADYSQPVKTHKARLNDTVQVIETLLRETHDIPKGGLSVHLDCEESFEVQSSPGSLQLLLLKLTLYRNEKKTLSLRTAIENGVPQIILQDEDPLHIINTLEKQAVKNLISQCSCGVSCSVHPESGVVCKILFATNVEELREEEPHYPNLEN